MRPLFSLIAIPFAVTAAAQSVSDTITVTATRTETRIGDTPASVVVLSREDLKTAAAPAADDVLRQVPGFSLFRRSGSRTANPTSQGVSMRGIGASGASRALVVDDGIPLNDPFGGWVYWGRVQRASLERVELLRGGASDLYGSSAMGGVIQFVRRRSDVPAFYAQSSGGSQSTGTGSMFAATVRDRWGASLAADVLHAGGYVLVASGQRGRVDVPAGSRHTALDATVEHDRGFIRGSFYTESRDNGTPLQTNDTTIRQAAAGADGRIFGGSLTARGWGSNQDYAQTFSAIAADRNSERLTVEQRVPARSAGLSMQWARAIAARNALVIGAEARQVSGSSNELQHSPSGATSAVDTSGRQRTVSAFAEDVVALDRMSITAGVRFDGWRNFDAERNGAPLEERTESSWSPRLALLYRASDRIAVTATTYRAFRAPSLNELFRGFRVGNVVTLANESLSAERLDAIELGVRIGSLRATVFRMEMNDVISNVTLSATPTLITRQRQNIASSRSQGIEIDGDWRLASRWRASAGYLFADSEVTSGESAGRRLPQVPRNQLTAQLMWAGPATIGIQSRWSSMQFDDDRNALPLRGYFVTDVFVAHPLAQRLDVTLSAENIFNRRIEAGATPVITLGQPRAIHLGLRYGR